MPMPHRTFAQVAKRRLIGKEGRERIREVNALWGPSARFGGQRVGRDHAVLDGDVVEILR